MVGPIALARRDAPEHETHFGAHWPRGGDRRGQAFGHHGIVLLAEKVRHLAHRPGEPGGVVPDARSHGLGGIPDAFGREPDAVLESRLNRENPQRCHEIINFAVYGSNPLFQLAVLDKAATFRPEAVLYVAHPDDANRVVRFVMQSLHGERILSWLYTELVGRCHRMGIAPGYVLLPMVPQMRYVNDPQRQVALARQAGFAVADLSTVYAGSDRNALWVAEWDAHPNAAGHRLVADRLHAFVEQHRQALLPDEPRPPVAR